MVAAAMSLRLSGDDGGDPTTEILPSEAKRVRDSERNPCIRGGYHSISNCNPRFEKPPSDFIPRELESERSQSFEDPIPLSIFSIDVAFDREPSSILPSPNPQSLKPTSKPRLTHPHFPPHLPGKSTSAASPPWSVRRAGRKRRRKNSGRRSPLC